MENAPAPTAAPIFKKRNPKNKSSIRKRATPPPQSPSSSSNYSSSEDSAGHKIKRRKKNTSTITANSKTHAPKDTSALETSTIYTASRDGIQETSDATKSREWYDEKTTKSLLGSTRSLAPKPETIYKPLSTQTSFISKNPNAPPKKIGPIKAASNIRTITTTDFAPDVCKDYKQTGFCGFGDNCKFLHAREDYKQGWQLDKEWENVTKGKKISGGTKISGKEVMEEEDGDDDGERLDGIPFACVICKGGYKEAVSTRCGHYFCEKCALGRYRRDPGCAVCGAGTGGVFNVAKGLRKLLDRKRERVRKRREKAKELGEELSDEEDEEGEGVEGS